MALSDHRHLHLSYVAPNCTTTAVLLTKEGCAEMFCVSDVSVQGCSLVGLVTAGCLTILTGLPELEDLEGLF